MTNQEVNEFMQRFLDDDLNEDELEALMEHIRLTPASAILFERLQRLDSELAQLPKVTPPMSIVDSILPRLELAGLDEHTPMIGTVATADIPNRVTPVARRAVLRDRVNYRVLGGVVAAGIVLTLFFTNFGPQMSFDTADEDAASKSNMAMDNVMVAEGEARITQEFAPAASPIADEAKPTEAEESPTETSSIFTEPLAAEEPVSDSNSSASNDTVEAPTPWVDNGKLFKADRTDAAPAADAPISEASPSPNSVITSDKEPAAMTETPADDRKAMLTSTSTSAVVSPDEQLTGMVTDLAEGGQRIMITDQSGSQVYESAVYQGSIQQLTWSPDSTQLHFEAILDNETTVHMTIQVSTQTESLQEE